MKSKDLKTKIFLDSGDPQETKQIQDCCGFLDGQTTNPSLVAKAEGEFISKLKKKGTHLSQNDLLEMYRYEITNIAKLLPNGSVSIEVYADHKTKADEMLKQGKKFFSWIPNSHIKYPTTKEGLQAAQLSIKEGMRVNMTLVFTQEQAAAVYVATFGAKKGDVFVSPFIGRLDDRGENGMDLIKNILKMYESGDGHIEVLTASVRGSNHFLGAIQLGSDIITAPSKVLKEWADGGMKIPDASFKYEHSGLKPIPYKKLDLTKDWQSFNISHHLTDSGLAKFSQDWKSLLTS